MTAELTRAPKDQAAGGHRHPWRTAAPRTPVPPRPPPRPRRSVPQLAGHSSGRKPPTTSVSHPWCPGSCLPESSEPRDTRRAPPPNLTAPPTIPPFFTHQSGSKESLPDHPPGTDLRPPHPDLNFHGTNFNCFGYVRNSQLKVLKNPKPTKKME